MKKMDKNFKLIVYNKNELEVEIRKAIEENGNEVDLNYINVSAITDMREFFLDLKFNGDISKWDVSSVVDMSLMFRNSSFKGDVSHWKVFL
jgi:surface protein